MNFPIFAPILKETKAPYDGATIRFNYVAKSSNFIFGNREHPDRLDVFL